MMYKFIIIIISKSTVSKLALTKGCFKAREWEKWLVTECYPIAMMISQFSDCKHFSV